MGHLARLGDTHWMLWPDAALRGAGFPAEMVRDICDDQLAEAADLLDQNSAASRDTYDLVYASAVARLSAATRRLAAAAWFREAIAWQNPTLIRTCLDRVTAGEPRNARGRAHELAIGSYLQRYCLKNDTVGFFGPVGWARISHDDSGLALNPGPALLSRRTTYFENWAVEAVAEAIATHPQVWPWLRPRPAPSARLSGRTLAVPFRRTVSLSVVDVRVLSVCDGRRTVRDIAGEPPAPQIVASLLRLQELGAVNIGLTGPLTDAPPETVLTGRIAAIEDPSARALAHAQLDDLATARDALTAAAGRADGVTAAIDALAATFEKITAVGSVRRHGGLYAGRTVVVEDTVRHADVRVGERAIRRFAAPLGMVLDSALWLANAIGDRFEAEAMRLARRELARTGGTDMPFLQMVTALLPEFGHDSVSVAAGPLVDEVVVEFQRRWRRVLGLPDGTSGPTRRHHVRAEDVADIIAQEFATGHPKWSGAGWHSPDIMVIAKSPVALASGDIDAVLGELHCASNTLEYRLFVAQHPAPQRLRAAALASKLDERIIIIPRLDSYSTNLRTSKAAQMLLPGYTYVTVGAESLAPPPEAMTMSASDLVVLVHGDGVVVRNRLDGREYRFIEVIGDLLSAVTSNAFRVVGGGHHRPRVSIDRLVVARETWSFRAADLRWAFVKREAQRYAAARQWQAAHALPDRVFLRVPVEAKPTAVDFGSLVLVNLLAKSIRRTAQAGPLDVTITEMLPDITQLWLTDADGARYTAELRIVAVRDQR